MNTKKYSGFTLVELIIVITILAILATIAFVSFQNYVRDSRDSNRLTTMKNIETGLQSYQISVGNYPEPDNYSLIQASGSTLMYQGNIGNNVSKLIKLNKAPIDPIDQIPLIYSINASKLKYEILGYMENNTSYMFPTYPSEYTTRFPKTIGNNVGIILNQDNSNITGNIDLLKTNSGTTYKVIFNTNSNIGSGKQLITYIGINDKTLAIFDESLVGYWDMESTIMSGGTTLLKDLSPYGNNGILGPGVSFTTGIKNGQALNFKGRKTGSFVDLGNSTILNPRYFTISTWLYAPNIVSTDCYNYIYSNSRDILSMTGIDIKIYCVNQLSAKISNAGGSGGINYNSYNSTVWNFLTWTYDGTTLSLYVNGKNYTNSNIGYDLGNNPSSYNAYLGAMGYNPVDYQLNGNLDDFRIYNKVFSSNDVMSLYASY